MDGMSAPSNRTEFRRDTTTTAHRHGSRRSNGSRVRNWSAGVRSRAVSHGSIRSMQEGRDPTFRTTANFADSSDGSQPGQSVKWRCFAVYEGETALVTNGVLEGAGSHARALPVCANEHAADLVQ